ncbi:MAG TPA: MFS transporter [Motilibacterales bacterium]|nr:MFS transporter [Motilibacterales bacterium]
MQAFQAIFVHPGTVGMTAAGFVGRFPMAMLGLAMTMLVVAETGSYGRAGAVAAAITLAGAIGGPLGARLADRIGQHRAIPPLIGLHIVAVAGLTVAVMAGTPMVLWLGLGVVAGLSGPNLGAMVRTRWAGITQGPDELTSAFALESTLDEVAFVLGPPLATGLAVAIAPWSAIATGLLLAASGALALAAQSSTEPDPTPRTALHGPSVWRSGTLQVLTLLMVLMGAIFGALEVSTVAVAQEADAVWATGWLLGVFALSSGLTGLFLGARPGGWRLSRQVVVGSATLALATAAIPFIDGLGWYAAGMFAAGLGVSAVMIGAMQIIERALPRTRLTEALALAISGVLIGSAAAVALAGALIDAGGSSWGLAVGSVAALGGLAVAGLARPSLARAESVTLATAVAPVADHDRVTSDRDDLTTVPAALPEAWADGTAPPG